MLNWIKNRDARFISPPYTSWGCLKNGILLICVKSSLDDYIVFLKGDFVDDVYLQQNSFDPVDNSVSKERQEHIFEILLKLLSAELDLDSKDSARSFFNQLRLKFLDYNGCEWESEEFKGYEKEVLEMIDGKFVRIQPQAEALMAKN